MVAFGDLRSTGEWRCAVERGPEATLGGGDRAFDPFRRGCSAWLIARRVVSNGAGRGAGDDAVAGRSPQVQKTRIDHMAGRRFPALAWEGWPIPTAGAAESSPGCERWALRSGLKLIYMAVWAVRR